MIGASANIVSVGMAKKLKHNISFFEFTRQSAVITHSHDTVDLKQVNLLVTENGIMDRAAIAACIQRSRDT